MTNSVRSIASTAIKSCVGIAIIAYLIYHVGGDRLISVAQSLSYTGLLVIIISTGLAILIGTLNIHVLLHATGKKVAFQTLAYYYLISWSIGLFVPGKVGEFSIILFLKKYGVDAGTSSAISILDKAITILTLFIIATIGFFIFLPITTALYLSGLEALAMTTGIILFFTTPGRTLIKRTVLAKAASYFTGFGTTITKLFQEKKTALAINFILTSIKWGITTLGVYLLLGIFGVWINLTTLLVINSMISILSIIPISISGLGIRESVGTYLLAQAGVEPALAASILLIGTMATYLVACATILFYVTTEKRSIKEIFSAQIR